MAAGSGIRHAFGLLSVFPLPASDEPPTPRCSAWFPWVGVALGAIALAVVSAVNAASAAWGDGGFLYRAGWPMAVMIALGWAVATRLLHWDGLADVADAWWGGSTSARRLEIMADSSVGAFGAATVAFVALAQVSALSLLLEPGYGFAVFAVPVFGRASATFGAWLGKPARPGGLGSRVAGPPTFAGIVIASAALGVAGASMIFQQGVAGGVWSLFAFVVAAAVPHLISRKFGGITGDVLGASVLVTETVCLMAAALVVSW